MQINKKILNIPPYISCPWKNISALYFDDRRDLLMIVLTSGNAIEVPNLNKEDLNNIFRTHAEALNADEISSVQKEGVFGFKLPLNLGDQLSTFGGMMQHNSDQMHSPPLPSDLLNKIAATFQTVGVDHSLFPPPEPHCNCPHCQIARAIHQGSIEEASQNERVEIVSDEDLHFRDWEIEQTDNQLYIVTNPLNKKERYSVFLGKPLGCTCGELHCEHIRAVLKT